MLVSAVPASRTWRSSPHRGSTCGGVGERTEYMSTVTRGKQRTKNARGGGASSRRGHAKNEEQKPLINLNHTRRGRSAGQQLEGDETAIDAFWREGRSRGAARKPRQRWHTQQAGYTRRCMRSAHVVCIAYSSAVLVFIRVLL